MSREESKKREKRIIYNFTSMIILMTAISIGVVAGTFSILLLLRP